MSGGSLLTPSRLQGAGAGNKIDGREGKFICKEIIKSSKSLKVHLDQTLEKIVALVLVCTVSFMTSPAHLMP